MTPMAQTMLSSFEKQADSIGKKFCIKNLSEETDNQELFIWSRRIIWMCEIDHPKTQSVSITTLKILQP